MFLIAFIIFLAPATFSSPFCSYYSYRDDTDGKNIQNRLDCCRLCLLFFQPFFSFLFEKLLLLTLLFFGNWLLAVDIFTVKRHFCAWYWWTSVTLCPCLLIVFIMNIFSALYGLIFWWIIVLFNVVIRSLVRFNFEIFLWFIEDELWDGYDVGFG